MHSETVLLIVGLVIIGIFLLEKVRWGHVFRILKSYWVLKKLKRLGKRQNGPARQFGYLRRLDPFLFEEVVLTAFKKAGCRIQRNRRYTGDGGSDGQCWVGADHYVLQMKRYTSHINPQHLKTFNHLCRFQRKKGFFIHTGKTGPASKKYEKTENSVVKIISGDNLLNVLVQGRLP